MILTLETRPNSKAICFLRRHTEQQKDSKSRLGMPDCFGPAFMPYVGWNLFRGVEEIVARDPVDLKGLGPPALKLMPKTPSSCVTSQMAREISADGLCFWLFVLLLFFRRLRPPQPPVGKFGHLYIHLDVLLLLLLRARAPKPVTLGYNESPNTKPPPRTDLHKK